MSIWDGLGLEDARSWIEDIWGQRAWTARRQEQRGAGKREEERAGGEAKAARGKGSSAGAGEAKAERARLQEKRTAAGGALDPHQCR
jgi:hypothetical protein